MNKVIAGRFEIQEILGHGGMGTVYKGHDQQTDQPVAVKTVKRDILLDDPDLLERFEREGIALRQLNHPNIVKMITAVHEDTHYLVMEYVDGGSLFDLMREIPQLPIERILQLSLDLADALTRAHRLKIIHRDIKPANVLLTKEGTPRLTDFGVARIGKDSVGTITKTGAVVGTYSYLSPEACEGKRLDSRTDIWSFGVMLYEMLAGRRPFEAETQTAVLLEIMTKPMPDIFELRPDIPPKLALLVTRMLEKDKDKRISSVRLVGAELEAMIDDLDPEATHMLQYTGESRFSAPATPSSPQTIDWDGATITPSSPQHVTLPPTPAPSVVQPPTIPARWGIMGIVIAVLLLAVLGGLFLLSDNADEKQAATPPTATPAILIVEPVAPDENMVLVADFEQLGDETQEVERFIAGDLTNQLETGAPITKIRVRSYDAVITSEEQALQVAEENGAQLVIWGNYDAEFITLNISPGVVETTLFHRRQVEESLSVQLRLENARQQSVALPVLASMALIHTFEDKVYASAISYVVSEQFSSEADFEIVSAGISANLLRYFSNYFVSPELSIQELTRGLQVNASNPILYLWRGNILVKEGQYTEAERDFNTAIRLTNEQWAAPYTLLANNAVLEEDIDAAIERYSQAIALQPNDWFIRSARGGLYYLQGDYENAKADLDRSLDLQPAAALPYITSNILAIREGRVNDSIELLDKVITDFPDPTLMVRLTNLLPGGQESSNRYFTLTVSAFSNMVLGQYEAAIADADAALAINDDLADLYMLKGIAYCVLEDYETAEATYTQGIELEPDFIMLYMLRAEVRSKQGDLAGSVDDFQVAQQSDVWPNVEAIISESGTLGCEAFFGS